jgi:hypothetical protein
MKRFGYAILLMGLVTAVLPGTSSAAITKSAPNFTTPGAITFVEGSRDAFTISVTDRLKTMFRWSGRLPTGLTFVDKGVGTTATLSGSPAVGSAGKYPLIVQAVDTSGAHTAQNLLVTVSAISSSIPVVQTVSPNTNSGRDVTITGNNFKGATSVLFGIVTTKFTVESATSITAAVPTGAAGSVDVTVTSSGGTSPVSIDDRFNYAVAPQQPVITSVEPESLGIFVQWAPNATSDEVTRYSVTATVAPDYGGAAGGPVPKDCATPPTVSTDGRGKSILIMGGVCTSIPYVVSLIAINKWGTSPVSVTSNPAVPLVAQPPSAPLITSVFARSGALIINWAPPAQPNGEVLVSYLVTATPIKGVTKPVEATVSGATTQLTITGLTNDLPYKLSLMARAATGDSPPGLGAGTPSAKAKPDMPASLLVAPNNNGQLVVTWSAPNDTGSNKLNGYVITYTSVNVPGIPSSKNKTSKGTVTISSSTTSKTLSGLVLADYYSVSVSATSSSGAGMPRATLTPITPKVTVAPDTHILSASTMNSLISQKIDSAGDGSILIWPASTNFGIDLLPGMVVVGRATAAAPHGLLAVVQTISTSASGKYLEVDTTTASLGQAFWTFSFSSSIDPGIDIPFNYPNSPVIISGTVHLDPSVSGYASLTCTKKWFGVCVQAIATGGASASLKASEQLAGIWNGAITIPLASVPLGTQAFVVGVVPVTLDESLDSSLIIDSTGVSFTSTASVDLGGEMDWSSSSGFSHTSHSTSTGTVGTDAGSTNSTTTAELQVALNVCAYGSVLCGDVAVSGVLTGIINVTTAPYFSLCPSVAISAGFAIDLLFWSTSSSATLGTFSYPPPFCFYINNSPVTLLLSPSPPTVPIGIHVQTFVATRSDGHLPASSWSLLNGIAGDSISPTGQLSTGSPGNRILYLKDVDSTLPVDFPTTKAVTVGTTHYFEKPANLKFHKALFPYLTWDPLINTGGSPLDHYIITINGVTDTSLGATFTGTMAFVLASDFQSSYYVQVIAVNQNGVASPPATLQHWVGGQIS